MSVPLHRIAFFSHPLSLCVFMNLPVTLPLSLSVPMSPLYYLSISGSLFFFLYVSVDRWEQRQGADAVLRPPLEGTPPTLVAWDLAFPWPQPLGFPSN